MKRETLFVLIGGIREEYIREAAEGRPEKKQTALKWCSAAACFVMILTAALAVIPGVFDEREPMPAHDTTEALFECAYRYHINEGMFSSYLGGKVISEDRIGDKIEDVTVTAGWIDSTQTWSGTEILRGAVYAIDGVPMETAAALRMIDPGDAITTTHYYVILNPTADLSVVEEYRIVDEIPYYGGYEAEAEIPE